MKSEKIMLRIYPTVLLILLVDLLSRVINAVSANPCIKSENSSIKTWGPRCKYGCHCKHNRNCDVTGYCLNGCAFGWTRLTQNGSCSLPIVNNTFNKQNVNSFTTLDKVSMKKHRFTRESLNTILYRFSPSNTCIQDHRGIFTKIWHVTADPPVMVKIFNVSFDLKPRDHDIITSTFKIKQFENYSITPELTQYTSRSPNLFSIAMLELVIADSISIAVASKNINLPCSPVRMTGFFLYGLPVCPYRKWGLHCTFDCQCPCNIKECHPTTGSCLKRGFACPPRKYGPVCSYNCSPMCSGYPQQCHVLLGTCKECKEPNITGVECQSYLTSDEQSSMSRACEDFSALQEPDEFSSSKLNISEQLFYRNDDRQGHKKTVAFIIFVFLIVFLLLCCSYVQMLHYCAKKRLREQFDSMNEDRIRRASMVTYTELQKEYDEMQEYRRRSSFGSPGRRERMSLYTNKENLRTSPHVHEKS